MFETKNVTISVLAFLHPSPLPLHHSNKQLKCAYKTSQRVQLRASLAVNRAAVFDYVSQNTSGSKRDVSRLRVLLDNAGLKLEDAWLLIAARVGDAETVEKLLKSGADPNVADTEGSTSLMRAISRGHVEAARVLLADARIDIKKKNDWGYDAVIYLGSVRNSKPEAFRKISVLLESYGIDSSRNELRWSQKPKRG